MARVEDLYTDNLFSLQYKSELKENERFTDCIRCKVQPKIINNEDMAICPSCLFGLRACGHDLAERWNKENTYERRKNYDLAQPMSERTKNRDYILESLGIKE